ncbi:MAG: hypothetical protein JWO48_1281 [Bryobacterales bacterium]|nr:hypothetical protein [Bryobacterales bacterium]
MIQQFEHRNGKPERHVDFGTFANGETAGRAAAGIYLR